LPWPIRAWRTSRWRHDDTASTLPEYLR
jgi:hypothetical protein